MPSGYAIKTELHGLQNVNCEAYKKTWYLRKLFFFVGKRQTG